MSSGAATDRWIKCISAHGNIRGVAIQATGVVREIARAHGLKGMASQALGEAIVGALTLASYCKNKEHINLNIQSSGLVSQALVDAHPDGSVRGYVVARETNLLEQSTQGPWGEGLLSVLRTKNEEQERPYIGTVPLLTGHLAKDLTFYWLHSEQVPSAVGIAIKLNGTEVIAAGGFLIQAMPGASPEELKTIESHINEIESLAERISENPDPMSLLSQIFQDTAFILVEEKPLTFNCTCSWERVNRALALVGIQELQSMLSDDNGAFVRCDFCGKEYNLDSEGLKKLIEAGGVGNA